MHRQSHRRSRSLPGSFCQRQAHHQRNRRGGRVLRPHTGAESQTVRRHLLVGLRRSASTGVRSCRLGAHVRLPGRCGRSRSQMVTEIPAIDAGDRMGPLGRDGRTGQSRRHEPENVQCLSGRIKARDRKRVDCQCDGSCEAPDDGLSFPPGSVDDIPGLMRLKSEGGHLDKKGVVEVISSLRCRWQLGGV